MYLGPPLYRQTQHMSAYTVIWPNESIITNQRTKLRSCEALPPKEAYLHRNEIEWHGPCLQSLLQRVFPRVGCRVKEPPCIVEARRVRRQPKEALRHTTTSHVPIGNKHLRGARVGPVTGKGHGSHLEWNGRIHRLIVGNGFVHERPKVFVLGTGGMGGERLCHCHFCRATRSTY